MIEFLYVIFFWILVVQVFIFMFLNIPTPHGWKGAVVRVLTTSQLVQKFMKVHLMLLMVAGFFYWDLTVTESMYRKEKSELKLDGHLAAELRRGYLSYTMLKIQRNEYITFMLIYVSLALNIYIQLLNYMYNKRSAYEQQVIEQAKLKEQSTVKS